MNYFLKHSFITKRECQFALSFCVVILFKFCLNNERLKFEDINQLKSYGSVAKLITFLKR